MRYRCPFHSRLKTPCDLPGSCSQHRMGARPKPSSPQPRTSVLVSTPGWPLPTRGVAGCPAPALLLTLLASPPCLVCKRTLDEAPHAAGIHMFTSYHLKAAPGAHSEILTLSGQLPSLLPSPMFLAQSLLSVPNSLSPNVVFRVLPENVEKEWSRHGHLPSRLDSGGPVAAG